jgi:hypothetical protein
VLAARVLFAAAAGHVKAWDINGHTVTLGVEKA